jgi:hypothetical protein
VRQSLHQSCCDCWGCCRATKWSYNNSLKELFCEPTCSMCSRAVRGCVF